MFVEKLFETIQKEFCVTKEELLGDNRRQNLVVCRRILSYYLRKHGFTYCKIAEILNKEHSTIMFNVSVFDDEIKYNPFFISCYKRVKNKIDELLNESKQVSE